MGGDQLGKETFNIPRAKVPNVKRSTSFETGRAGYKSQASSVGQHDEGGKYKMNIIRIRR